jgi:hypothetical protein
MPSFNPNEGNGHEFQQQGIRGFSINVLENPDDTRHNAIRPLYYFLSPIFRK